MWVPEIKPGCPNSMTPVSEYQELIGFDLRSDKEKQDPIWEPNLHL